MQKQKKHLNKSNKKIAMKFKMNFIPLYFNSPRYISNINLRKPIVAMPSSSSAVAGLNYNNKNKK